MRTTKFKINTTQMLGFRLINKDIPTKSKIGSKVGEKPVIIGSKIGSKPVAIALIGSKIGAKPE